MRKGLAIVTLLLTFGMVGLSCRMAESKALPSPLISRSAPTRSANDDPAGEYPTPTSTASVHPTITEEPTPTHTPTPTLDLVPTEESTLTSEPTASRQVTLTETLQLAPTMTASPTRTSTETPSVVPTSTPTQRPTPTSLPSPTATNSPTPVPTSVRVHIPMGERFIVINQQEQMMHIYDHGGEIRRIPCSTGLPDPDKYTPAWTGRVGEYWGTFFAFDVYADEAWYLFKSLGSILIHSSPYVLEDGEKVYQDVELLGKQPASHGCIRIHPDDARWFTEWSPQGALVVITPPELG